MSNALTLTVPEAKRACTKCKGSGRVIGNRCQELHCDRCAGSGRILRPEALRVALEAQILAAMPAIVATGHELAAKAEAAPAGIRLVVANRHLDAHRRHFVANRSILNNLRRAAPAATYKAVATAMGRPTRDLREPAAAADPDACEECVRAAATTTLWGMRVCTGCAEDLEVANEETAS